MSGSFAADSFDLAAVPKGRRLLSDSSQLSGTSALSYVESERHADLSLTELSLDPTPRRALKFSILPQRAQPADDTVPDDETTDEGGSGVDETILAERHDDARDREERALPNPRSREDALQLELFNIRRVNQTLHNYHVVLQETLASRQRFATTAAQTNALLDEYIKMMARSEQIAGIVFDEQWQGAEHDAEIIEREQLEAERAQREAEERARVVEQERLRREQEELERQRMEAATREEAERRARDKGPRGAGSGVRGVRGTRASMRGVRATGTRGGSPADGSRSGTTRTTPTSTRPTSRLAVHGAK